MLTIAKVVCNDDLPVTILDQLAAAVGRSQLSPLARCNTVAITAKISSKIYRVYFQMVRPYFLLNK